MMGLPWIELHTNLPTHPKSLRLARLLGRKMAWAHMAQLWLWCAEHCPDGLFSSDDADVIECAAGWDGEAGVFAKAAIKAGFLDDSSSGAIVVRGWQERALAHIAKLQRDSERQKERRTKVAARFGGRRSADVAQPSDGHNTDVARTSDGCHADVAGNSNPNPNPDSNKEEEAFEPLPLPRQAVPAEVVAPATEPHAWNADDFWAWAQSIRRKGGYVAEAKPPHRRLSDWFRLALSTEAVDQHVLKRAFYAFGADPYWEKARFPFAAFMKHWQSFAETGVRHAAAAS